MLAAGREELTCDLAETYGILDPWSLPASRLAVLASGLREESRICMKMAGASAPLNTLLLAVIADCLTGLLHGLGKKRGKRPVSFVEQLAGAGQGQTKQRDQVNVYPSGEAFDAAWRRLTGGERNG